MKDRISKPGLYPDLPIDVYHADCCDGPSLSSSGIRTIISECPAKFWATSYLNPKRFPEKASGALDFGRAAHSLALGEPEFARHFAVSPYDDFRSKEAKEWRDAQTKTVVRAEDMETILAMCRALQADPIASQVLSLGAPEVSAIWRERGIWLKARPDWLSAPDRWVGEYKTTISAHPDRFPRDAYNRGYHVQAAMVLRGLHATTGNAFPGVVLIAQEKDPPYLCAAYAVPPELIEDGNARIDAALETFRHCWDTGDWYGYGGTPFDLEAPKWARLETRDERAEHRPGGSASTGAREPGAEVGEGLEDPSEYLAAG